MFVASQLLISYGKHPGVPWEERITRHFHYMKSVGDPVTKVPVPDVRGMLESAVKGETYECTSMYPEFAKVAREEGFDEIAKWFETLTKAEKAHSGKFQEALNKLK